MGVFESFYALVKPYAMTLLCYDVAGLGAIIRPLVSSAASAGVFTRAYFGFSPPLSLVGDESVVITDVTIGVFWKLGHILWYLIPSVGQARTHGFRRMCRILLP